MSGGSGRFDVFDDALIIVESNVSRRQAWAMAGKGGRTVEPHEHTPDCGHGASGPWDDRRNGR